MAHPFGDWLGLEILEQRSGYSRCALTVQEMHLNPHGVVHGAVLYALADTGMGAALYPSLASGEICATIEIKISYYRPVSEGRLTSEAVTVHRGRRVAYLEASIYAHEDLVAKASGSFLIFTPRNRRT